MSTNPLGLIDAQALQRYVSRRKIEVEQCRDALLVGDFETLRGVAHKILGNFSTFGFDELEQLATDLQNAARDEDRASSAMAIEALSRWVERKLSS